MASFKTAFGVTTMMALSALMLFAAFEPVFTNQPQATQAAARAATSTAA